MPCSSDFEDEDKENTSGSSNRYSFDEHERRIAQAMNSSGSRKRPGPSFSSAAGSSKKAKKGDQPKQ